MNGNGAIFSPPFCTRAALVRIILLLILQCILIGRHIVAFTFVLCTAYEGSYVDWRARTHEPMAFYKRNESPDK